MLAGDKPRRSAIISIECEPKWKCNFGNFILLRRVRTRERSRIQWCRCVYIKCEFKSTVKSWTKKSLPCTAWKIKIKLLIWMKKKWEYTWKREKTRMWNMSIWKFWCKQIVIANECECVCVCRRECVRVQTIKDVSLFVTNDHETTSHNSNSDWLQHQK